MSALFISSPPLPPANSRLLSDMGYRIGRTGRRTFHAGMDLGSTQGRGTPVLNVQAGVARVVLDSPPTQGFGGYGNAVVIEHGDGTWALYGHLDAVSVRTGDMVPAGAVLGGMGNTSNGKFPGMGVHLHLELRQITTTGRDPFPGPYRTNNLDPRPWLAMQGLTFGRRGGFEIAPGSEMARAATVQAGEIV